ncbi:cytochrome b [Spartinivicinus ruber]|uniref:cytochrome b n=1 Tax=Spartinivicinus ruber TaxID=2683272 RepID=UPI0013D1709B|nr:cytochrome b [Spartinivicinus ruber]
MNSFPQKLSRPTKLLHWLIALGMIGLLLLGWYMAEYQVFSLYDWHKSLGVVLFVIAVMRIAWRLKEGWPDAVSDSPKLQRVVARATHWVLIICTAAMPISGMVSSGYSGYGFGLFGLAIVPTSTPIMENGEFKGMTPFDADLAALGHDIHEIGMWVMAVVIILHVLAAMKHHLLDRDATLRRMLRT